MISVKVFCAEDVAKWDAFVCKSRMPMFMFERGFMDYHQDRFEDHSLLFYRDDELIAVLPASRHGNELRSHGGLTYGGLIYGEKMKQHTMLDCFAALKDHCMCNGLNTVLYKNIPHIYHRQPAEEDHYALFVNQAQVVKIEPSTVVNLKSPYKMLKGRKAQISRAKREGVIVSETNDFGTFIQLENLVLSEHHGVTAVHTAEELGLLAERFPANVKCVCGCKGRELLAGSVLFVYDNVVHTQYLAANGQAREIGALDLVISHIINDYRNTHEFLDFGISSEAGGHLLNEGLIAQKEGFGGRTEVYQTWELSV